MSKESDNINPKYYNGTECLDTIKMQYGVEAGYHFCLCNAFKYIWRHKHKNGIEDLRKADWYLNYIESHKLECPVTIYSQAVVLRKEWHISWSKSYY